MATGRVKRLVTDKGFGFIKDDSDSTEYFFHRSALSGGVFEHLVEGARVRFEPEESAKGPRATKVQEL